MIRDNLIMRICVRSFAWVYSFPIPIISFIYYVFYVTQRKSLLDELLPYTFSSEILNPSWSGFLHYWLGVELTRIELYKYCFCTIDKFEDWLEGWFNIGHKKSTINQIYRDNFAEWLSWGFFSISLETARNHLEYSKEIDEIIESVEKSKNIKFREGYNPNCECIKLTLDPVKAIPKPFILYTVKSILNGYWSSTLEFDIQEGSHPSRISYWYYDPHSRHDSFPSKKKCHKKPIVFIHGVGGGLFCYSNFIRKLSKLGRPLFLVELPYVSMQMVEDVPTMEETVREIKKMLISRNFQKAIFVGHSLGSVVCSWMLKEARKYIGGLILVDPIIFLLHHPNVAYNFKYRTPRAASECILYISSRYILPNKTYVYISENDNLVPSKEVYKYLVKHNVNVHMMHKLDHGSFLFDTRWENQIIADVLKCCNSRS
ncbi:8448_t:CDS:2 [Cetraspora pellucida]|uniref:8448_t:CDS:1 n=1 Tax=Cetraspora pellucida TaxID=1433469 RepID=A0A9N9D9D7_9GLOM|nr:8448_t:CDS:2 [Cetraspora pellucida]